MKTRNVILVLAAIAVLGAAAGTAWWVGMSQGMRMASGAAEVEPANGRKVLYWHDPMVPAQRFDKPGKSPFMDMQLVPVYADEGSAGSQVAITSRVEQNLGVRTADVVEGNVAPKVEAVGSVAWNERDVAVVQARASGYIEKLQVRAPLDRVKKGDPLAELYVPDWIAAQEEYLSVTRMQGADLEGLRDAARQRMRLAGMTDAQVALVTSSGKAHLRTTIAAPISGVVSELSAREGMTVASGAPLFRINGLATVWVNAELPESLASVVRAGDPAQARAAALPGETFKGRVAAILPEVNATTRTLKVRLELANPGGKLVPGMFVTVDFAAASQRRALLVPTEAVIQTGQRTVVLVAAKAADGTQQFRPVEVQIGSEANGMTEIRKGLERGQRVVASGQFLIDSEASLKAAASRLSEPAGGDKP
ncbi:MAG TPA: efflux RND transporter periplasmic adaptor subunit [Usitatibacter sp.]|nr:efflux RND transporter periplasmic adaptor subunit [Usitatibacter sp.]